MHTLMYGHSIMTNMYFRLYNIVLGEAYGFTDICQQVPISKQVLDQNEVALLSDIIPDPQCPMHASIVNPLLPSNAVHVEIRREAVASFLNRWNYFFLQGKSFLYAYVESDGNVGLTNFDVTDVWVFLGTYGRIVVPASSTTRVSIADLVTTPQSIDPAVPIVVSRDVPVFHIEAVLHRKNERGSYVLTETVEARQGVYADEHAFVEMLNEGIRMRGERNGTIYHVIFNKRKCVLEVEATHRQPLPSEARVTPLGSSVLGFEEPVSFPLRTRGKATATFPMARLIA